MWESKYLCVNIRFKSQLMIIVALQMKNINHMYMTTWLVLHAAINLQAKQSIWLAVTRRKRHYLSQ